MRHRLLLILACCVSVGLAGPAGQSSSGSSILPPDLVRLLREIKAADSDELVVSEEDGRFLRLLAASSIGYRLSISADRHQESERCNPRAETRKLNAAIRKLKAESSKPRVDDGR